MAIAMVLGGFTAAQADELRRAMGHRRKLKKLEAALDKLKASCIANGVSEAVASEVVDDLHSFANYGFPESHAWSFALIAYATAYRLWQGKLGSKERGVGILVLYRVAQALGVKLWDLLEDDSGPLVPAQLASGIA